MERIEEKRVKVEVFLRLITGIILITLGEGISLRFYFASCEELANPTLIFLGLLFGGVGLFLIFSLFGSLVSENIKMAKCLDPNKINEAFNVDMYDEKIG